jgi:MFS family permease
VVCAGLVSFMAHLDGAGVTVTLPDMRSDFGASPGAIAWVTLAYVVPLVALSLLSGRWLQVSGRRSALTCSVIGFAATGAAVAAAPGLPAVVGARAVQGAFASVLLALAPVIAVEAVPEKSRSRALGLVSSFASLGALAGPTVGGLLAHAANWRLIFLLNVPVAVAVTLLACHRLPRSAPLTSPRRAWILEAALLGSTATLALTGLSGVGGDRSWLLALLAFAAVPALVWWRIPGSRPVRELLAATGMREPHLALVTAYVPLLALQFLTPFFMQRELGSTADVIGRTMLAFPLAVTAGSLLGGAVADRIGVRGVAVAGAAVFSCGLALAAPLGESWSPWDVAWRLTVIGLGFGTFATPTLSATMTRAGSQRLGLASATTGLARLSGLMAGPALATLAWRVGDYTTDGMRAALAIAALCAAVTISIAWRY